MTKTACRPYLRRLRVALVLRLVVPCAAGLAVGHWLGWQGFAGMAVGASLIVISVLLQQWAHPRDIEEVIQRLIDGRS